MIIDFHTHAFPDKIAQTILQTLIASVQKTEGISAKAYTEGTLDSLKSSMAQKGVDISVVLPIATTVSQSTSINNFAKEITSLSLGATTAVLRITALTLNITSFIENGLEI